MGKADFVISLIFGLFFICFTVVVQPCHWLGDLIARLGGAAILFLLGSVYGFREGRNGAGN
jgi:hypothetical protein